MKKLGIFGAGGHAKVVADTAIASGEFEVIGFYDDNVTRHGELFYRERCVLGGLQELLADLQDGVLDCGFIAIGNNAVRVRLGERVLQSGHVLATLIDPRAAVSDTAEIDVGTLVVAGAVVNAASKIGRHVIINTGAVIDHDCVLGDGIHIAPHATLCGGVKVGAGSFLGAASTIIPTLSFPADSILGAGSTLIQSATEQGTWVGSPARRLESKENS